MIVGVTSWVTALSSKATPSAVSTRLQMGVAAVVYTFFVVWCLTVQRFPWPFRRGNTPDLLVGGIREFPILFIVLVVFLATMAVFCFRRAIARRRRLG